MRIGILTTLAGPGPVAGGVWQVAQTQARALLNAGHEVRLAAGWLGPLPSDGLLGEIGVELFRLRRPLPGQGIRFLLARHPRARARDLARWADVLHVHLCRDQVTTLALRSLPTGGVPVVAQAHGMLGPSSGLLMKGFDTVLGRAAFQRPELFLVLTPGEREALCALGIPPTRTAGIHNAVDDPRSSGWRGCPETPHFVFASRLHPRKRPGVFVAAAIRYLESGRDGFFTVAGQDQGELPAMEKLIRTSKYREAFDIAGPRSVDDVGDLLRTATAMVLPSEKEPYPMIVLEAAALGMPMIVSRDTGVSHLLAAAGAAITVNPESADVANAMTRLAAEPARCKELSASARALYTRSWTPESLARLLETRYAQAIAGGVGGEAAS